ncbi:hypothetical protein HID58_050377 [Brassica napus]|uniref:Transmembrane protein n=1 Tax=Brassica napus TaxID=3708 RepID=A0ABQ8A6V3_BRANA|nr:hypothetical protein HID58_050377 [Brassica napus]
MVHISSSISLHISLYLYQKFLSISSPFHHHNRRPSCSSPPRSFDYVAFFTTIFTVTLVTITTGHLSLCLCLSLSLSLLLSSFYLLLQSVLFFFTDLRRSSDKTEKRSSGVTERHLRLSVVQKPVVCWRFVAEAL